ncbi:hypothetical protein [Streptomyces sp. NPDC054794]
MNTERPDRDDDAGAVAGAEVEGEASVAAEASADGEASAEAEIPLDGEASGEAGTPVDGEASGEAEASVDGEASAEAETPPAPEASVEAEAPVEADAPVVQTRVVAADRDADGDGGERSGRRKSPLVAASVAAAVLLVGIGGTYLAAHANGDSRGGTGSSAPGGDGTPPPLALDGVSEGGTEGIAPGEPNPYGVRYEVGGSLPDGPGSAAVYRAQGQVTQDEVARLAKALGIDGTPVAEGQTWRVGRDAAGPSLRVNKEAPGSWTFSRYAPGTDNCKGTLVCAQDPGAPADDPVTVTAAKKAAAPILKALGQDDAKVDANQVMGAQRVVNADPVVGGLPTYGWTTGLTVDKQGEVIGGNGLLKSPAKSDTYPVLSARKTLDLMNAAPHTDHRMGIGGCASPVPMKDRLEQPCGSSTTAPKQDTAAVTVEHAVFGLASHSVDGRQALVPSWLFEVRGTDARGTFTVTHPAIDPKYLVPASAPSTAPSAAPTSPGDRPTATEAPTARNVKVDGYTSDDRELTVSFTGGVCADYKASAEESADEVTVRVTETPWPDKVCVLIAKQYAQTVRLDQPLGTRKVVGTDGSAVPLTKPGARLPAPPSAR